MNKYPLVNICIPTYNVQDTIKDSLKSIISQSYKNILITIVDNSSNDRTLQIIQSFKSKKIKVFKFYKNVSAEENFSRCISLSKGEYTAIYHSDDIYNRNIVADQVCFLEKNKGTGAVFTEGQLINEKRNLISKFNVPLKKKSDNFNYNYNEIIYEISKNYNFFMCPTAMVRTKIYKKEIKYFNHKKFGNSADLDVWLRISNNHSVGIIKKNLISYRISQKQQTIQTSSNSQLSPFFKVVKFHMYKFKTNNILLVRKNLAILELYFYLFLLIKSIKQYNYKLQKKLYNIYLNRKKNMSFQIFSSKKSIYIVVIDLLINLTSKINFINKIIINFLYVKFFKI